MQIAGGSCEEPVRASRTSTVESPPQAAVSYTQTFGQYGGYIGFFAMFAFPTGGDVLLSAIVGAVCGGGGAALGSAVGAFCDAVGESASRPDKPGQPGAPLVVLLLSLVGLVAWLLPLVGLPVTVTGFVLSRRARHSPRRTLALTSMALSLIGLLLTSGNAYLGALMAVQAGMRAQGH